MSRRKKAPSPPETSYTLRDEQDTMFGLTTQPPQHVAQEVLLAKLAPEEVRLQRVVAKYRPSPVAPEQMGFGAAFGSITAANQLDLFGRPIARQGPVVLEDAAPPAPSSRGRARGARKGT